MLKGQDRAPIADAFASFVDLRKVVELGANITDVADAEPKTLRVVP